MPPPSDSIHATRPLWQYRLGRFIAWLLGWTVTDTMPDEPQMVVISGPHTSNWDGIILLMAVLVYRCRVMAMGKDSLFELPLLGRFFRFMGGIPIDRHAPNGVVGQMVELFDTHERLILVVPASGTRSRRDHWKSGFYWVAHQAGVPIGLSYMDYENRIAGFRGVLHTTGDVKADMDRIRETYADIAGKHPANRSDIRLREEPRSA